eukprot:TRINITY_DN1027_c0_g1_i1.p1 TRINITY_DN1027_c0_g1~~TRINITY_DN1027_c0_g1_i1.p1  ORF type:complete len:236 (+),score=38.89 TRINITY_DN1027_c0_g1_i1:89-796(+)
MSDDTTTYYKVDYASIPYEKELPHIRIGRLRFHSQNPSPSPPVFIKVLLNPTDARRALRLILCSGDPRVLDRSFDRVEPLLHLCHAFANVLVSRMLKLAGALNVNIRAEGNNRFKQGAEEREGLHYHVLGRYNHGDRVLNIYEIDHPEGVSGDIPLGHDRSDKKPLCATDPEENARLCMKVTESLRPLLQRAFEELYNDGDEGDLFLSGGEGEGQWKQLFEHNLNTVIQLTLGAD